MNLIMKTNLFKALRNFLFLPLFTLVLFNSCQNEVTDITETNSEETFTAESVLAQSMLRTTTFDGSYDNIIDSANCISVNLPVTVIVNGVTITIEDVEDYEVIEDIFDEFNDDDDNLEIVFPITIILTDYEEIFINNYDELYSFVEDCLGENEDDDDIECIDFQYPINVSIFNSNFDFIETVQINNDEQLYEFIEELEGGVFASINFPVNMILADGSTLEVNSNTELQAAIEAAEDSCDEDDDYDYNDDDDENCTEEFVELSLKECIWNIVSYNGDDNFINYYIDFDPNYGFTVSLNGNVVHDGSWTVSQDNDDLYIEFETSWEDLNGNWEVEDCDDDRFKLEKGDAFIIIEQECDENINPLGCLEANDIVKCDENNDGFEVFNLYEGLSEIEACDVNNTVAVSYHNSLADAESNVNPISEVTAYTNVTSPQTIYVRIQVLNNPSQFEVLEINLILENCNTSDCSEEQVDAYLMECHWEATSYNGDNQLEDYDIYFNDNMSLLVEGNGVTYEGVWSTEGNSANGVFVTITQLADQVQDLNGQWFVAECTEAQFILTTNDVEMVLDRDCTTSADCNEDNINSFLLECTWNVVNYNGSDDLIIFDFNFNNDGTVLITGDGQTITAMWSTSVTGDGVWVEFGDVNAGNIQAITGNWLVVECEADRLKLEKDNAYIIIERTCN